ncbi:hypothetical protein PIB30_009567 [Stylosanthes scabra]|uniref:Uncharacterized protein n=1 Tax=Stylosanthes scabra TaxID=79078 RepID=A0ABU6Q643_9FABA|nr:hypothetical protein [Stylosanthes scabra]
MELLTEMQNVHSDVGGPLSSARGGVGTILRRPFTLQMEPNFDEDSNEDFVGDMDDTREISDGVEFVLESQSRRRFLLPASGPIPDLSSVSSHFHMLYFDAMDEEPRDGFGRGGEDYDVDGRKEFKVGQCSALERLCIWGLVLPERLVQLRQPDRPESLLALQHLHALPTVFTDGHLDAARTDSLAVGNYNRVVGYISTKFMTKYSLPTDSLAVCKPSEKTVSHNYGALSFMDVR